MLRRIRIQTMTNRHRKWYGIAAACCVLVMLVGVSLAWYSSSVSFLNGYVTLGELLIETTVYQPVYDDDGNITGVASVEDSDVSGTAYATGLIAADSVETGKTSTRFLKIENKGTMDVRLLLSLVKNEMLADMSQYDSGYFKLAVTDISDAVTNDKGLSHYATDMETRASVTAALSDATYQLSKLTDRTVSLGSEDDSILKKGAVSYYRFDLYCDNLSTAVAAKYTSGSAAGAAFALDAKITAQQTGAPWSDSGETTVYTREADSKESFLNAVENSESGDTIILMADIVLEDGYNLTFYHRVNLNLNGHTLTVRGNLTYDYADSGTCTVSVTDSAKLVVCGDFAIYAPNSGFSLKGSNSSSVQIGNAEREGMFSVNCVRDYTDDQAGFVLDHVSVINAKNSMAQELLVYGDTTVNVGTGSVIGEIRAASGARNIAIVNNGCITSIDLSEMSFRKAGRTDQIYIDNNGQIGVENPDGITLPSWSVGEVTSPSECNTTVVQGAGAGENLEVRVYMDNVYYSAQNSTAFKAANASDWENRGWKPDSVSFWNQDVTNKAISVKVERTADNEYAVYMDDEVTDSVRKLMTDFFRSDAGKLYTDETSVQEYAVRMAESVKAVTIRTYGSAVVVPDDFSYMRTTFVNLETLDISGAALEDNSIPESAMKDLGKLKKLSLPSTVASIGAYAFYGCSMEELTLPSSVTSVGEAAFQRDADKSQKIYVTWNSENQIGRDVLSGFDPAYTRLFMSEYQALNMESAAAEWAAYTYESYDFMIKEDSSLTFLKEVDGDDGRDYVRIVFYEDTGAFDRNMIQSSYTPDSGTAYPYRGRTFYTKSIGVNAFRLIGEANVGKTVALVFPDTCTQIRANAFRLVTDAVGYQISKLDLNYVDDIGEYAFYRARIMYSKARPDGTKGKASFAGMTNLGRGSFEGVQFYPADVSDASEITSKHFEGKNGTDTVYEAGTLDLSASRNTWSGDWSSAQPQLALQNMTAAGAVIKLGNYYRFGDYAYQTDASTDFHIRLYGVKLDLSGCEYLSKQAFKDSFPLGKETAVQSFNVLDLTDIKGYGYGAFENDYIGTVYAGITDLAWERDGADKFSWSCTKSGGSDTPGTIFAGGNVLTLDVQGHIPELAESGTSIFGNTAYGTIQLHQLADGTEVAANLFANSVADEILVYDVQNLSFGTASFLNVTGSGGKGTQVSIQASGTITFGKQSWYGSSIQSFSLPSDQTIVIGDEAFYGISFEDMQAELFETFYGILAKNQKTALICGSTFPDDMTVLDLSADSAFSVCADNQYQGCKMNQIASILWPESDEDSDEGNRTIAYEGIFADTEWPNLVSLSLKGAGITGSGTFRNASLLAVTKLNLRNTYPDTDAGGVSRNAYLLPQSTFEGADLSGLTKLDLTGVCIQPYAFRNANLQSVAELVTDADRPACMCDLAGAKGQQFAYADLTGLSGRTVSWHVTSLGRAAFFGTKAGSNVTWIWEDLTQFDSYLTFADMTEGSLALEFPVLTTCIPADAGGELPRQYLAQFDSSTAICRIEFGASFGKNGIVLAGSCTTADGAAVQSCEDGTSSSEFRGLTDCTIRFCNADNVVQILAAWDVSQIGTGVQFIVPQKLLTQYQDSAQNPNWSSVAAQIAGDNVSYATYTYLYVGTSTDEVQLLQYSGDDTTLVVPELITVTVSDGDVTTEKTLKVTQLSAEFLAGAGRVQALYLPTTISYIDPAMFDGSSVETISFYRSAAAADSSGDAGLGDVSAAYYRAENTVNEVQTLAGVGERTVVSTGKLLMNGSGTVLMRAMPGAVYNTDGSYYEIPVTVKGIGSGAFAQTGVTAVSMTAVTSIAGDAFTGSAKDSGGNSITTLKFAMAEPPVLIGDALQIFRTSDAGGSSVRLEGRIVVPGMNEAGEVTDEYRKIYQSASGFAAYGTLIQADSSLVPYTEPEDETLSDFLLTYTDGRGVTWYYTLGEDGNAALTGVKEGIPADASKTCYIPAAVSDETGWYPVSTIDFAAEQSSFLNEIKAYKVMQQMQYDGTLPDVAQQLYTDEYGVLYRISSGRGALGTRTAVLLRYPAASELLEYTLPDLLVVNKTTVTGIASGGEDAAAADTAQVEQIAPYAFYHASGLNKLYIPTSVLRRISIGEKAFAGTADDFTVLGGDAAGSDVVILKTEVDQETWEKIQKWLSGEAEESDLPEEPEDTDDGTDDIAWDTTDGEADGTAWDTAYGDEDGGVLDTTDDGAVDDAVGNAVDAAQPEMADEPDRVGNVKEIEPETSETKNSELETTETETTVVETTMAEGTMAETTIAETAEAEIIGTEIIEAESAEPESAEPESADSEFPAEESDTGMTGAEN